MHFVHLVVVGLNHIRTVVPVVKGEIVFLYFSVPGIPGPIQ